MIKKRNLLDIFLVASFFFLIGCSRGITGKWVAFKSLSGSHESDIFGVITHITIKSDSTILYEHYREKEKKPYGSIRYYFKLNQEKSEIELYPLKDEKKGSEDPNNVKDYYYTRYFKLTDDGFIIHEVFMRTLKFKREGWF